MSRGDYRCCAMVDDAPCRGRSCAASRRAPYALKRLNVCLKCLNVGVGVLETLEDMQICR